jgi:hypothetical protein
MTPEGRAELEAEAVDQARKGDTFSLVVYLSHQSVSPLRGYIIDVLEHTIKVPKPRPHAVEARETYSELATFASVCEHVGMSPTEAVRETQDHFGLDDNKQVWRARKRFPFSDPFLELYLEAHRLFGEALRENDYLHLPPKIQAELTKRLTAMIKDAALNPPVATDTK